MARGKGFSDRFRALAPVSAASRAPKLPPPGTPSVVLVGGSDSWLRQRVIRHCVRHHLGKDGETSFRLRRLNGATASRDDVLGAVRSAGFSGGSVVVVRDSVRLTRPDRKKRLYDVFPELVKAPKSAVLILEWEKSPGQEWSAIEKALRAAVKAGHLRAFDCDPPPERALGSWISRHAASFRLTLPKGAAALLVSRFGRDVRRIHNELEKLSVWSSDGKPTLDDLSGLLGEGSARDRFRFSNAVEAGRPAEALALLDSLLAEGESPLALLNLLYNLAVRIQIVRFAPRGESVHELLGVPTAVGDRIARAASRFDRQALGILLIQIADVDHKLKSTSVPPRVALAAVTLRLAGTAPKDSP